jgi:hypothetical protein
MGDIFEKVKDSRTLLEKLTDFIPGWGGYQERQTRRKADQAMRQTLADDVGSAVTQLQTFTDRVRLASYGYSGLFDAVKVNEAELEQMYNFDVALFEYVGRLETAIGHLRDLIPTGEGLEQPIRIIQDICREANTTFDQREHVILGSA